MKKLNVLIILLISVFVFTECGKYEEGPTISFRSRQKRIEGLWKINKLTVENTDSTSFYSTLLGNTIDISDGTWDIPLDAGGIMTMGGEWNWHNLKYYVEFDIDYALKDGYEYLAEEMDTIVFPYGFGPFLLTKSIKWEIIRIANNELILSTSHKDMIYKMDMTLQKDHD